MLKIYVCSDTGRLVAVCEGSASKELSKQKCVQCVHVCSKITDEDRLGEGWMNGRGGQGGEITGQSISKPYLRLSHQDLFSHLLDLLGFGLNVIFQLILPSLNHLQPLYLVLQGLPALLLTQQK